MNKKLREKCGDSEDCSSSREDILADLRRLATFGCAEHGTECILAILPVFCATQEMGTGRLVFTELLYLVGLTLFHASNAYKKRCMIVSEDEKRD